MQAFGDLRRCEVRLQNGVDRLPFGIEVAGGCGHTANRCTRCWMSSSKSKIFGTPNPALPAKTTFAMRRANSADSMPRRSCQSERAAIASQCHADSKGDQHDETGMFARRNS